MWFFSPNGIETLIANAFGTWGRRYVTNQALPINPLAVYRINKNTDLRTYEEKTYDYTKFENAIIKKFGISGSDADGKLAKAKTVYNAGQKLARWQKTSFTEKVLLRVKRIGPLDST